MNLKQKEILERLWEALRELEIVWEYAPENSPLDYACAVPYCTIKNLIDDLKRKSK